MEEDFIRKGALGALLVIISLIALGAVPPQSVGGVSLRRINIMSQILDSPESEIETPEVILEIDEEEYVVDLDAVAREVEQARDMMVVEATETTGGAIPKVEDRAEIEEVDEESDEECEIDSAEMVVVDTERLLPQDVALTPIENLDTLERGQLDRFYRKLSKKGRTTRVAVLGDSFIEGDILTADLREALQMRYGGCGAGFTPMASPLTKFRRTIKTESEGWQSYNIMQRKSTPERYAESWAVSGWLCTPNADGSSVKWECTDNRERLDSCSCVRLLFVSQENCEIRVSLNDGDSQSFSFEGSEKLQQIKLSKKWINTCQMSVVSGASGFVGYGAIFEGEGVVVDNFSTRSNNGQAMLWTNPTINAQMDGLIGGYDMVILQYGLNILQRGVKNYTAYSEQIEKMIAFARLCFPRAAVVVMGVSDRSMRESGHYEPVVEAIDMTNYQRDAARRSAAAFWDTHAAMGAQGGMAQFVANNWAAKDFTHINFEGGRQIGYALAEAINAARIEAYPPLIEKPIEELILSVNDRRLRELKPQRISRDWALERQISRSVAKDKKEKGR